MPESDPRATALLRELRETLLLATPGTARFQVRCERRRAPDRESDLRMRIAALQYVHMQNPHLHVPVTPAVVITRGEFLSDRHGKTFADVTNDPGAPFDEVLEFFNDAHRQQRMEDSEIHHDRAPLAGVVRELESVPAIRYFLSTPHRRRGARLRQAIGVLVRMIMERRGWRTTGKKGSLGVRSNLDSREPNHNTGGLALWFLRAERYRREAGMPFRSVRERCEALDGQSTQSAAADPAMEARAPGAPGDGSAS